MTPRFRGWVMAAGLAGACVAPAGAQAIGPEFRVNSYTTGTQYRPSVAASADGRFVVTWHSYLQDGSGAGVFGRRFHLDVIFADSFQGG